jgi:hypothetical protein
MVSTPLDIDDEDRQVGLADVLAAGNRAIQLQKARLNAQDSGS